VFVLTAPAALLPAAGRILTPSESVHPDDLARVLAYLCKVRQSVGACEPIRFRRKRKDGTYVDVESTGSYDVRAALLRVLRTDAAATDTRCAYSPQGTYLYAILRDVSEQHVAEAALRSLLLSSSFDLRINAQNVQAASALLLEHEAVRRDPEAGFLAGAITSSCNLLLGACTAGRLLVLAQPAARRCALAQLCCC
jgi:hypothetical protein